MSTNPAIDSAISYGTGTGAVGGAAYISYLSHATDVVTFLTAVAGFAVVVLRLVIDARKLRKK